MVRRFVPILLIVLLVVLAASLSLDLAFAKRGDSQQTDAVLGTTFTYQGRLMDGGEPANANYDLRFMLFTSEVGGSQVGSTIFMEDVPVSEGYFTVLLDFGMIFNGQALWLDIGVRPGPDTGEYTSLAPRQLLTATPFASYSSKAPWSGLSGVPADFADGVDDNNTYSPGNGLELNGEKFSVIYGGSGVANSAARSDHTHLGQNWSGNDNAFRIGGSFDTLDNPAPIVLSNQSGMGLQIDSAAKNGIKITSAGWDGVNIVSTAWDGVNIGSSGGTGVSIDEATYYGVSILSAGWAGVLVNSTQGDGLHVNSADQNGVAVVSAGQYGVWAESNNSSYEGGHFENSAAGGTGLFALGGDNLSADLVLGGTSSTNDDGRILSDMRYASSDVLITSNDAILFSIDENEDEGGDFWILNGANATVFSVNENGDMYAMGLKSAVVPTKHYGKRKLYAMESPQNWFEDFGSSQLIDGSATVAIEPVFAETVNLEEEYFVFLTPLGDCPLFVAEKTSEGFTVRAMSGTECSIAFDYRIIAKRLGYEDLRLEPYSEMGVDQ